ncbi:MAG: RNA methyltransferase [Pseudomonadota bacterium]
MTATNIIPIIDRGDPRIAPFIGVRERDLTGGTDGRFIVEGKVPLGILLRRSRFEVESLFLCGSRLVPLADLLREVPDGVPVYTAPQSLMDEIAGFPIHRGILACARKGPGLASESLLTDHPGLDPGPPSARPDSRHEIPGQARDRRILVLNQISNHDNVGAAFRNAAAFGVDAILLDGQSCDPLYRKAIRVSSGASLWLPFHHGGTGETHIEMLKAKGFTIWAMTPRADAAPLQGQTIPDKLAILLGAEGPGLPAALLAAAQPVRIPMVPDIDSINVATAGAIALAHVFSANEQTQTER